jgi:hypothetical protein
MPFLRRWEAAAVDVGILGQGKGRKQHPRSLRRWPKLFHLRGRQLRDLQLNQLLPYENASPKSEFS